MSIVDWAAIIGAVASVIAIPVALLIYRWTKKQPQNLSHGGKGGSGTIVGGNGIILGGRGGASGPAGTGQGGDGGSGTIIGGSGVIIGGDGGEAGQTGRGGRGGASPFERLSLADITLPDGRKLSDFGRGGDGWAPPIIHSGQRYQLSSLIRHLSSTQISEIDSIQPKSTQEWWDQAVTRWPDFTTEIILKTQPLD